MDRSSLGRTGLRVGPLGLGTVKLGRTTGVKYPRAFELPSDEQAAKLLEVCRAHGVNLLDTAPAYGVAEERLGRLLAGQRDQWVISTKVGESFDGSVSAFDFSSQGIRTSLEQSLARLDTSWVDVLLVHSDGQIELQSTVELVRELESMKAKGLVKAIGISPKTPRGGFEALQWADVLMLTLNPGYLEDLPVVAAAAERGVGVFIKKALDSGRNSNVRECLSLSLSTPGVGCVVVGTSSPENLENNCRIADELISGS